MDDTLPISYHVGQKNKKGQVICGAKNQSARPCGSTHIFTNGRCKFHGGPSLSGVAHPNYIDGRRSKYLPQRLQKAYGEIRADEDLFTLRDDAALVEARLLDVLGRVDTGESGKHWTQARAALTAFDNASDPDEAVKHLAAMRAAVGRGVSDYAAWNEIKDLLEQRRRLVADERKHVLETGRIISIEQLMLWVGALLAEIRAAVIVVVDDELIRRKVLSGIQTAFTKLANTGERPSRALPEPGGATASRLDPLDVSGQASRDTGNDLT